MMEEEMTHEQPIYSYDETFPVLPGAAGPISSSPNPLGTKNNSMRIGCTQVTQVFHVAVEERKFDHSDEFGEGESLRTCLAIMKESGAHIEISSSKDQSLTFLVTGKQNEVLEARRRILTTFQTNQAYKQVNIPKEHHGWILGKQGQRLKDLEKTTATKIQIPSIQDQSDIITITGTKEGIEKAEHEIKVISDQQLGKTFERVSVPKIYHPFIYGAHNENLNAMIAKTGARITIPPPSVQKDEITIAGEKKGVLAAKNEIQAIFKAMQQKCTTICVEVPKSQHKYVIGPRGSTIAEILQLTGVSVEMPASDSSTEIITLRGPQKKLGLALHKVYEKANRVRSSTVEAPTWIHKYIIGKKGANIKRITQHWSNVHVEFSEAEDKIKIEGPPEEIEKIQTELQNIVTNLINKFTFAELDVDSKFYKDIIGKNGTNVNRLNKETGVGISMSENDGKYLIHIEGNHVGVEKAKKELMEMVEKLENEKEKDVIIDHRHYRSIIGSEEDNIKEIRDKFNQVQITMPGPGEKRDVVKIRGPKEDVDKCHKHLMKLVKELNENSYVMEVPIFKQFHKFVIGQGGANIRKIWEESQTKIDLPAEGGKSHVFTLTGKKENVEEANKKIQKILANIVTDEIVIPPKFYNSLIGTGGKLIHSIMEDCGGVAIKFPTAESHSDKVSLRGPKDDVEKAKQHLLKLSNEHSPSSFSAEVRAKAQHHKFLIGKNGANIKKIRESTGARIIFPTEKDEDKEVITIIGKQDAVDKAKAELETTIKEIDNITESEISMEPKHHRHFLARFGEVLQRITEECGGVQISFPRTGSDSDRVVIKGAPECIKAAKQRMLAIVRDLESMVTIECVIPRRHHRAVMGVRGCKVQGITAEFNVQITFPDRFVMEEQRPSEQVNSDEAEASEIVPVCDIIRITGQPDNAEAARQALLSLVPITIKVDVPNNLHGSIIGHGGRDVKELMEKYDVHIVLSRVDQNLDYITITGTQKRVEEAKEDILEKCKTLEARRQNRVLKSHEVKEQKNTMVFGQILENQDKPSKVSLCESSTPSIRNDTIGCESTGVENRTRDMSSIQKESTDMEYQIQISHPTEEVKKVQMEMQKFFEKINVSCNSMSLIQQHNNIIMDALKCCNDSKDHLAELYNDVISKQESKMKELQKHLDDQVLSNKALKEERTQLMFEIYGKRRWCEEDILAIQQQHAEETTRMSDTIKDIEANLKTEQEEKSKLVAKIDEMSTTIIDLCAKQETLQDLLAERQKREEFLISKMKALREKEVRLDYQLNESKNSHNVLIKDKNSELAHQTKQIQDLTMMHAETNNKLIEVISKNEELSKAVTERVEEINRLKNILENEDGEISRLKTDLRDAIENKSKSSKIIQSLKEELLSAKERNSQTETDFNTYRDNMDKHATREKSIHEAKLKRIESNVYDLKEKLMEITQDIHASSEICEDKNPSNLLTDDQKYSTD